MIDAVEDARQRRARIDKPRCMVEQLRDDRLISIREFDVGMFLRATNDKLMRRRDIRAEAVLQLMRDELNKIERGTWAMVREVCIENEPLRTVDGTKRFREALQAVALKVDVLMAHFAGADGVA